MNQLRNYNFFSETCAVLLKKNKRGEGDKDPVTERKKGKERQGGGGKEKKKGVSQERPH